MTELIIELIQTPRGYHDHYGFCTALNRCNNGIINPQVQPDPIRFVRFVRMKG